MQKFSNDLQKDDAVPPFTFENDKDIQNDVLKSNFNWIPIHIAFNGKPFDKMLWNMDADMCPYQKEIWA